MSPFLLGGYVIEHIMVSDNENRPYLDILEQVFDRLVDEGVDLAKVEVDLNYSEPIAFGTLYYFIITHLEEERVLH